MTNEWGTTETISPSNGESVELPDMDQLFEQAVDQQEVQRVKESVLKPAGNYVTQPVLTKTLTRVDRGPHEGRTVVRYFGQAQMTVTEKNAQRLKMAHGEIIKAGFNFTLSHEIANKFTEDGVDTGKPDLASRLWANAVDAFKVAYERAPASLGEVYSYVENYPVVINVIQVGVATKDNPEPNGDPGNIVMRLYAVREPSV